MQMPTHQAIAGSQWLTIPIMKIISGGQTGVDRGALDAAIALGIEHGGWCPLGRLAEDAPIPARYQLRETDSPRYAERTERNVLEADATLILFRGKLSGGTRLTRQLAVRHKRPCLVIDLEQAVEADEVHRWLRQHDVSVLNVAGPRESQSPGIGRAAEWFLTSVFRRSAAESE